MSSECPKCGQRAPIVLKGLDSRCAACGAPRFLLAAPNVSFAGQPSRVGGVAASLAGIGVLGLGASLSAGLWFLGHALSPSSTWSWALAVPVFGVSMLVGLALLIFGTKLRRSGSARRRAVELEAVSAMVRHRRGPISAYEVAQALELPEPQVDALLTELARAKATAVTLDVDAEGHIVYDFEGEERRWRVLEEQAEDAAAEPAEAHEARAERLKRR
ncbi:MAG TPA: hypothetical protein VNG33_17760 [Polyangiaceae bacterium]|nr:hypothetical protein [Polyangiaceae bacterium]